jgi:hypothetical protein
LAISVGSHAAEDRKQTLPPQPFVVSTNAEFRCGGPTNASCNYIIYSDECKEGTGPHGKPALICTHELIDQFSLKSGETRKMAGLPQVKQCTDTSLGFPACAR